MPFGLDKVFHAAAYACLGLLIVRARDRRMGLPEMLAWLLLGAAFGAVDEWIQRSTPGRTPAASDWVADVVGFGMALMGGPWVWSRPILRVLA